MGRINKGSTQDFYGIEITLYDTIMVDHIIIHLYKPTERTLTYTMYTCNDLSM